METGASPARAAAPAAGAAVARGLLVAAPVAAVLYALAVLAHVAPSRPPVVGLLAALPIAALAIGWRRGARGIILAACLELALLVPLHALLTLVRAARLDGG